MKKAILILISIFLLAGCATYFTDVKIKQQESKLYVGMPYEAVVRIVGREPNKAYDTIKEGTDSEGRWFVWVVGRSSILASDSNVLATYTFKFRNGRLVEWWSS